ncbi:MAG: hypothetical protein WAU78_00900 [Roseiarcus sp.]
MKVLSACEAAALRSAAPTLRRFPRGFVTAPADASRRAAPIAPSLVRDLVARGLFAWGNDCHSFVTLTAAGRQAAGGAP